MIRRLGTIINIGGAVAGSLTSAIRRATQSLFSVGGAVRNLESLQRRLNERIGQYIRQGRDITNIARIYGQVRRAADDLRRTLERLNQAQQQLAQNRSQAAQQRGELMEAVGLAASLAAPVMVAANFERAMDRVGAISRATDEDMARLTETARMLGATTEWSASDAAQGMQFLAMAGFQTQEMIDTMPGLLNLATAGAVDLGEASDIAASMLRGFGLQASDMGRVADVMVNTFTTSNTNLTGLGETMKYVAPVAAAMGLSIEEVSAAVGQLGNAGIQGSQAGTSLRMMLTRLAAPTARGRRVLEELGVATVDSSGNLRDLNGILADMSVAMRGFGNAEQQQMISHLFGVEALSAATILLGQAGTGNLERYTESLRITGSAAQVAGVQADNTVGAWKEFQSAVEELAIITGNALLPVLTDTLDAFSGTIVKLGQLAERYPQVTRAIVLITSALITLKIVSIAGTYAWTVLNGVMITARIVMLRLGAAIRLVGMTMQIMGTIAAANPIGLIITAIAIAALLLYFYWDPIKAWWLGLWSDIEYIAHFAWEAIKEWLGWDPVEAFRPYWEPVANFFSTIWNAIYSYVAAYWGGVISLITMFVPMEYIEAAWMPVYNFFVWLWDAIFAKFSQTFGAISSTISSVGSNIAWAFGMGDDTQSVSSPGEMRVDQNGNPIGAAPAATGIPGTAMPAMPTMPSTLSALPTGAANPFLAQAAAEQGLGEEDLPGSGDLPDLGAIAPGRAPNNNTINMNVTQQPFESGEAFADRVTQDVMRQLEQRQGGALYDGAAG